MLRSSRLACQGKSIPVFCLHRLANHAMASLIGPGGADMLNYPGPIVWHGWNSSDTEHRARYMYAASWLASDGTIDIFL